MAGILFLAGIIAILIGISWTSSVFLGGMAGLPAGLEAQVQPYYPAFGFVARMAAASPGIGLILVGILFLAIGDVLTKLRNLGRLNEHIVRLLEATRDRDPDR